MTPEVYKTLEITCWAIGVFFGIAAGVFKVLDGRRGTSEKREAVKEKYKERWESLRDSGWDELPEKGVKWLMLMKLKIEKGFVESIIDKSGDYIGILEYRGMSFGLYLFFSPGAIAAWLYYGWHVGIPATIIFILFVSVVSDWKFSKSARIDELIAVIYSFCSFLLVLIYALSLDFYWTALVFFISLPSLCYAVLWAGYGMSILTPESIHYLFTKVDSQENFDANIGFALSISFIITALALVIGSLSAPNSPLPQTMQQTMQLFLANVICDGITLILTYFILGKSISGSISLKARRIESKDHTVTFKKLYPIPVAILLDVAVAALLACLSLYLGLLDTENALTFQGTINVLIARSPDGAGVELGPYFWAMHTTFIPTLFYLTIIFLAYIGKWAVLPVADFFKINSENDNPHKYSIMLFSLMALLSGAGAAFFKYKVPAQFGWF